VVVGGIRAAAGGLPPSSSQHIAVAAALDYATQRGWLTFPARFVLDNQTGKWEKKSWKSAKSSNGRPWGMTKHPDEIRRDFEG
jgi:hypothetical protein